MREQKQCAIPLVLQNTVLVIVLVLCGIGAFAQVATLEKGASKKSRELYEEAGSAEAFGNYKEAAAILQRAVDNQSSFIDGWYTLGLLQMEALRQYPAAIISLEKVKALDAEYKLDVCYQLGRAYFYNQQYDKAKEALNQCKGKALSINDERQVSHFLKSSDFAVEAIKHPKSFLPKNLGKGINTPGTELMPTITADERFIYFTRIDRSGNINEENIYVSKDEAGKWDSARMVESPVSLYTTNDGATCISPSGKYLFFTSCDRVGGFGNCDIYFAAKTEEGWGRPRNMGGVVNTPGKEIQPSISADGRTVYFASNRRGGYGGLDIYSTILSETGEWSEPKNLGPFINTEYDEERPFIHPDDQTLYFSSDGHPGFGGSDFFVTRKSQAGDWSRPENLGYPINGPGDEIGIVVTADGKTAYFASERTGGEGDMDIYQFDTDISFKPSYVSYVKGKVTDSDTRASLKANIQLFDVQTGKLYSSLSTDAKGEFLAVLPSGRDYAMEVMKEGYLFYSNHFSLKDAVQGKPFEAMVPLKKIQVGQTVVLNNIFYESNLYTLKETSKMELNLLVDLLTKNPTLKLEIAGHTDNTGTEAANLVLSENRAKSVFEYIVSKGIAEDRISYKGYASSKAVADNTTEAGKAKNRRTEYVVTGI
jgi:outer membrane protein OmpA-like peptidoglycan-associated protein/Tol biopolymer transport system component